MFKRNFKHYSRLDIINNTWNKVLKNDTTTKKVLMLGCIHSTDIKIIKTGHTDFIKYREVVTQLILKEYIKTIKSVSGKDLKIQYLFNDPILQTTGYVFNGLDICFKIGNSWESIHVCDVDFCKKILKGKTYKYYKVEFIDTFKYKKYIESKSVPLSMIYLLFSEEVPSKIIHYIIKREYVTLLSLDIKKEIVMWNRLDILDSYNIISNGLSWFIHYRLSLEKVIRIVETVNNKCIESLKTSISKEQIYILGLIISSKITFLWDFINTDFSTIISICKKLVVDKYVMLLGKLLGKSLHIEAMYESTGKASISTQTRNTSNIYMKLDGKWVGLSILNIEPYSLVSRNETYKYYKVDFIDTLIYKKYVEYKSKPWHMTYFIFHTDVYDTLRSESQISMEKGVNILMKKVKLDYINRINNSGAFFVGACDAHDMLETEIKKQNGE